MRILLCALDKPLQDAWDAALVPVLPVLEQAGHTAQTMAGDITALRVTAVVSPANSYGYMRGGVDLAYIRRFGPDLETAVRAAIAKLTGNVSGNPSGGLLPVGQALAVTTGDATIPWLISAPTMEVPSRLADAEPVFLAARAATARALDKGFDAVAFPGMGTGTGGLGADDAAGAMVRGICRGLGLA